MSAEYEQKVKYLIDHMTFHSSKREAAEIILAIPGVEVTPPEPQWEPGQVVRLRLEDGMPYLAKRTFKNDGWEVFGVDALFTDDEVTDVEPVAVVTAGDVAGLDARVFHHGRGQITETFRERGLDL